MPLALSCPKCRTRLSVPEDTLRHLFRCGACGFEFATEDDEPALVEPIPDAAAPTTEEDVPTLEEWREPVRPRRVQPEPERGPGCFSYGLALSPLVIPALAIPFCRFGTGWIGGVVWGAFGLGLMLACAGLVRRTQWSRTARVLGSLGIAGFGYLLLCIALGLSFWQWRNTIDPDEWRDFAPPGGRFHVSVPGVPTLQPGAQGMPRSYQAYTLELPRQDIAFGVGYDNVPLGEWNQKPLQVRFDEALNGLLANMPGSRVVGTKRIALDHNPGREYHLQIPDKAEIVARVYFVRNHLCVLLIAGSRLKPDSPDVARFLDSFHPDPLDEKEFPPLRPDEQPPDIEDEDIYPGRKILGKPEPEVMQLVVSRDGGTLAAACADGAINLWSLPDGESRGELHVADRMPQRQHNWLRLALSPDGTTLAAGTMAGDLKLFDTRTHNEVATLLAGAGQFAPIDCLTFSPDGRHLATGHRTGAQGPGEVRLWDVPARRLVRPIRGQKGEVTALVFSPDGRFLLCGDSDGAIRWLDPAAGGETKRFEIPRGHPAAQTNVTALAFTADGGTLASSHYDHTTRLWDVRTGKDRVALRHPAAVIALDVSPNGRFLATGTVNGQLLISEAETGNKRWERAGMDLNHTVPGPCLAFTPDGRRIVVVRQKRVELWDLDRMIRATAEELEGPKERPAAPAEEPVREPEPEAPPARIEAHVTKDPNAPYGVFGMGLSDGGKTLVTAGRDRGLRFWDLATGKKKAEATIGVTLAGMAVSPDGKMVAIAVPSTIYLYDAKTAEMIDTLTPDAAAVVEAGMSPEVREVTRRLNKGKMPRPQLDAAKIGALAFSPDNKTLAVSYPADRSGVVELWDVAARKVQKRFVTEPGADKLAFAPDGKTLAFGRDNHADLCLYDVATGSALTQLRGLGWGITALAYSGDGKYLAASGGGPVPKAMLLVWDARTGRELHRFTDQANRLGALAFSPDGRSLASGSPDGTVRVYDTASGQAIGTFAAHTTCLLFSHDGKKLFAGSGGWVEVWGVANLPRPKPPEPIAEKQPPGRPLAFGKDLQRAGNVEPFLSAAVDPKAGRALFLGPDRLLRVYSYPDCRPQKVYWLGATAYRTALDLEHGMLYAAVCDDLALQIERGGKIHGPADLHVYDVKKLLAGEDLPGGVVKPVAVIRRKAEISELFCTPDGRWVYYLDVSDPRNTLLSRIDTATRKPDRAVDATNLTGGVCLSRDGKTLYVGRTVEDAKRAPQHWGGEILMFDADTLADRGRIEVASPPHQIAADDDLLYFGGNGPLGVVDLRPVKPKVVVYWGGPWLGGTLRVGVAPRRLYVSQQAIPTTIRAFSFPDDVLRAKDNNAPRNPVDELTDKGDGSSLGDITVTPDGKYLLTRAGVVVRLAVPGMNRPLPPLPAEDKPAPAEAKGLPLRERDAIPVSKTGSAEAVAISRDGKMLAVGNTFRGVSVHNRADGKELGFGWSDAGVAFLAFNPVSHKILSTTFDRRGQVRVTRKGTSIGGAASFFHSVGGHGLDSIALTPDGREVAGAGGEQGKQVVFWAAENGRQIKKVSGFPDPLTAVALSPDGKLLAAGSTVGPVRQVDMSNPRQTRTLTGHTAEVRCVAYSPDGKLLASAGVDGTFRLWDPATGKERQVLRGHAGVVLCLAFSPDGKALVTGGADGTIHWWDVETGAERGVVPPRRPGAVVYALAFAPDGKGLAAACGAEVRQWDVGE